MRVIGNDIPLGVNIGKGLSVTHLIGTVINYNAIIGDYCTIYQNVTIGSDGYWTGCGAPKIGNNVVICAGAVVIGNVTVGDNVVIAAGSVVNKDVLSGSIVGGVPAHVLSLNGAEKADCFVKGIGK